MSETTRTQFLGEPLTERETLLARYVYELATDRALCRRPALGGPIGTMDELFPLPTDAVTCSHRYANVAVDELLSPSLTCRDCGVRLSVVTVRLVAAGPP